MPNAKPPILNSAIPDQWIADVREARDREGHPMRAHPTRPCIEVKSLHDNHWKVLMLPGSGFDFTDTAERDAALARLEAR